MHNSSAIELEPQFYNRWSNPQYSMCQIIPTTEAFELLFDLPGFHQSIPSILDNEVITFETFGGRSRLIVEKLKIYQTDYYGDFITASIFHNISRQDICSNACDTTASLYSPTYLYRVVAVNGRTVPRHGKVQIKKHNLMPILNNTREATITLGDMGINDLSQLMIKCTPIINLVLV